MLLNTGDVQGQMSIHVSDWKVMHSTTVVSLTQFMVSDAHLVVGTYFSFTCTQIQLCPLLSLLWLPSNNKYIHGNKCIIMTTTQLW